MCVAGEDNRWTGNGDGQYKEQARVCTEKSGDGDEESRSERADDDDMFLARLVHHPFRSRLLDLNTAAE